MKIPLAIAAACLCAVATAQTDPDPAVKTGDGKTAAPPARSGRANCTGMQGGVDASGGESVVLQAKASQASARNSANCGRHNGKASAPHAAPVSPNPDVKKPASR